MQAAGGGDVTNSGATIGLLALLTAATAMPAQAQEGSPLRFLRPVVEGEQDASAERGTPAPQPSASSAPGEDPDAPGVDAVRVEDTAAAEADPAATPDTTLPEPGAASGAGDVAAVPDEPAAEVPDILQTETLVEPEVKSPTEASVPTIATPTVPPEPAGPPPIRLGVLAGRDVRATMAALDPVAKDLSQILERDVEVLPLSSYGAMIDAQAQRRIDGGFYSTSSYAMSEASCRCLEPLVAPASADGGLAFRAIIVARNGAGISNAAGLAGRSVAIGAADSIGSRRMQFAGLLAEGIDPSGFGSVREVDSSRAAVAMVVSGDVDAAFAWSSMSGDAQAGYSEGTLRDLVDLGELDMSEISVVWRSPPVTHGPLAVAKDLEQGLKDRLETYLVGLESAHPEAYDMLNPFYPGGYRPVEPNDFAAADLLVAQNVEAVTLPADGGGQAEADAAPEAAQ